MPNEIKRQEAIALGLKRYFTGSACKRGHLAERGTVDQQCFDFAKRSAIGRLSIGKCGGLGSGIPCISRKRKSGERDRIIGKRLGYTRFTISGPLLGCRYPLARALLCANVADEPLNKHCAWTIVMKLGCFGAGYAHDATAALVLWVIT